MMDMNSLLIESTLNEPEYVTEWKVNSAEKEKIIKDALKKLSSAISKNKDVSKYCKICNESNLAKYNTTIFNRLMKKNMYTSKLRNIFLGEYDFGNTLMVDIYDDLRNIIEDINIKLPAGVKLKLKNTIDRYGNVMYLTEAGMFALTIKKNVIKESGTDFSESIMESLFGDSSSEYITEWKLNDFQKTTLKNAITVTKNHFSKNASYFKDGKVEIFATEQYADTNKVPLGCKLDAAMSLVVGRFQIPLTSTKYTTKLNSILDDINEEILPYAKIVIRNSSNGTVQGSKSVYMFGSLSIIFVKSQSYIMSSYEFDTNGSTSIAESGTKFSESIMDSLF